MKKVVKINESDLGRIVKRVINERNTNDRPKRQKSEKEKVAEQLQSLLYRLPPKTWLGDVKEYFSNKSMEEINKTLNQIRDLAEKYKSLEW